MTRLPPRVVVPEQVRTLPPAAPPAVVAIGSYSGPNRDCTAVVELNVRLVRKHCGPVPIIISDDHSPEPYRSKLRATARAHGCHFVSAFTGRRLGHVGGDLAAFYHGLRAADRWSVRYVVKLSQRMLIDTPGWLTDVCRELSSTRMPLATDVCRYGHRTLFHYRTEACVLDARAWNSCPEAVDLLRPRAAGEAAESLFATAFAMLHSPYLTWSLIGPDRTRPMPGVVWREAAPPGVPYQKHAMTEYARLATREGVELPASFDPVGWPAGPGYLPG